jgi:hypothetical protein
MALRFTRRVSLVPGLRLNASRGGLSLSIGHRGGWYTPGPHGRRRVTLGLTGSGLFWTEQIPPGLPVHIRHRLAFAVLVVVGCAQSVGLRSRDVERRVRKAKARRRLPER